jgi:NADH-quinone oxidoreductase subunit H
VIPLDLGWVIADINVGVLYLFAISSLGRSTASSWPAGRRTRNTPFLSALRAAAQMVSYEVSIGFVIITVLLCVGSLNLTDIVMAQQTKWGISAYAIPLFPMFVIFFISALAETNRPPFDLSKGESELVGGFMVEYSAHDPVLLFMLGEYAIMILMCGMTTILFLGGWLPPIPFAPFTWVPGIIWFA